MKFLHYFRHMKSSKGLSLDFERKFEGFASLIQTSSPVHVTFSIENGQYHIHVGLHAKNNRPIEADQTSEDMHKSIDLIIDKLHHLLSREKDKVLSQYHQVPEVGLDSSLTKDDDLDLEDS